MPEVGSGHSPCRGLGGEDPETSLILEVLCYLMKRWINLNIGVTVNVKIKKMQLYLQKYLDEYIRILFI